MRETRNPQASEQRAQEQPSIQREYAWLCGQIEACQSGGWSDADIAGVTGAAVDRVHRALQESEALAKADLRKAVQNKPLPPGRLESLVAEVLEKLPEKMRLLVALIHKEGLSCSEAAVVLGEDSVKAKREYCKALIILRIGAERG